MLRTFLSPGFDARTGFSDRSAPPNGAGIADPDSEDRRRSNFTLRDRCKRHSHRHGEMRAAIPVVAGVLRMPRTKFQIANLASALIWADAILTPGSFGLSGC